MRLEAAAPQWSARVAVAPDAQQLPCHRRRTFTEERKPVRNVVHQHCNAMPTSPVLPESLADGLSRSITLALARSGDQWSRSSSSSSSSNGGWGYHGGAAAASSLDLMRIGRRIIALSVAPDANGVQKRRLLSDRKGSLDHFRSRNLLLNCTKASMMAASPIFMEIATEEAARAQDGALDEYEPDWQELFADFHKKVFKTFGRIMTTVSMQRGLEWLAVRALPLRVADRLTKDASKSALRKLRRMSGWTAFAKLARTCLYSSAFMYLSQFLFDEAALLVRYARAVRRRRGGGTPHAAPPPPLFPPGILAVANEPLQPPPGAAHDDDLDGRALLRQALLRARFYALAPLVSSAGFAVGSLLAPTVVWGGIAGAWLGDVAASALF